MTKQPFQSIIIKQIEGIMVMVYESKLNFYPLAFERLSKFCLNYCRYDVLFLVNLRYECEVPYYIRS